LLLRRPAGVSPLPQSLHTLCSLQPIGRRSLDLRTLLLDSPGGHPVAGVANAGVRAATVSCILGKHAVLSGSPVCSNS
jgi:hypothetical protein